MTATLPAVFSRRGRSQEAVVVQHVEDDARAAGTVHGVDFVPAHLHEDVQVRLVTVLRRRLLAEVTGPRGWNAGRAAAVGRIGEERSERHVVMIGSTAMAFATLEFELPREKQELDRALAADTAFSTLSELAQHLRSRLKYAELSEETRAELTAVRELLPFELMDRLSG